MKIYGADIVDRSTLSGSLGNTFAEFSGSFSGSFSGDGSGLSGIAGAVTSLVTGETPLTLNDSVATRYIYTASVTAAWTLPLISASSNKEFWVKNRGSGSITLAASSSDRLYDINIAPSMSIYTGEAYVFFNDGTYWSVF